jgi:hypothetical protein
MSEKLFGINLWKKKFKKFNIVYECMKSMIKEWCDIIIIHKNIFI